MRFCVRCGKPMGDDASFCPACGAATGTAAPTPAAASLPGDEDVRAFVGPNADVYLRKFPRFQVGGVTGFAVTWHWPAFFLSFWWMLYRKLYLWAVAVFVLSLIPWVNVLAWFGWAMAANYLYFRHASLKIQEVRAANPGREIRPLLADVGGVNRWVVTVLVILAVLAALAFLLFGAFLTAMFREAAHGRWI